MKTIALLALIILIPSCAGITSAITKTPVPTVPVSRINGIPFNVATADVFRAESQPDQAWGLYNAGVVANAIDQVGK